MLRLITNTIPIDAAGNPKLDLFHHYLHERQIYEQGAMPFRQQQIQQLPPQAQQHVLPFQQFYGGGDHETHMILDEDD